MALDRTVWTYKEAIIAVACWPILWLFGFEVLTSWSPHEPPASFLDIGLAIVSGLGVLYSIFKSLTQLPSHSVRALVGTGTNLAFLIAITLFGEI